MFGRCSLVIFFLLLAPLQARTARNVGTIASCKRAAPAALDVYSSPLSPERRNPDALVHAGLTVGPSFDRQGIAAAGGKILRYEGRFLFISCRSAMVERIAALQGVEHFAVSLKPRLLMDTVRSQCRINEVHGTGPGSLPLPYTGKGVLTGILDTEFDTRHPAFLDSSGHTRFLAIWNQHDSTGAKKNRFGYGTIKFNNELITDTAFGLGDDSHGTQTSCAMAGSDRASGYYGAAPEGTIIAVRISGQQEIADGLRWICLMADSLKLPCVINMSLGYASGPHDGTSPIDRTIDSLSGPGRIIVGAVGNDGAGLSHIRFQLSAGSSKSTWIQPSVDSTPKGTTCYFGIDFWGEPGKSFTGKFLILDTRTNTYIQSGSSFSTNKSRDYGPDTIPVKDTGTGLFDTVIIEASVERSNSANRRPHLIARMKTNRSYLLWGLTLTNSGTTDHDIHGWHMDKKYFTGAGIEGFEYGDSLFTVNEVGGTAKRNITVGGYSGREYVPVWCDTTFRHECIPGGIYPGTGTGPTIDGRVKPDICAPAWSVITALSRNALRDRPEVVRWPDTSKTTLRYGAETGTSMASPIVAGIIALMLQAEATLTPEKIKTILTETAIHDEHTGPLAEKSNEWGAGKVNAYGAMAKLLGISVTHAQNRHSARLPAVRYTQGKLHLSPGASRIASIELIDLQGRTIARLSGDAASTVALPSPVAAGVYATRLRLLDGSTTGPIRFVVAR